MLFVFAPLWSRIIPARAGFTAPACSAAAPAADHPRSRGVYPGPQICGRRRLGSSPLARGLRRRGDVRLRARPDHPRSRGVYHAPFVRASDFAGSSPLARGLQECDGGDRRLRGIIPARAGFTFAFPTHPLNPSDHPRSRGVYKTTTFHYPSRVGSSPLARGLRRPRPHTATIRGIIPARAGFTVFPTHACTDRRDHPRSRGVYRTMVPAVVRLNGSSPLARGLPHHGAGGGALERIIPARAGFTK